ncbi:MAG: pilin [Elusimicrobiaceae bacterium]|nr:pilin [Elusimicrobiaceae bacterium]
MKGFTLMEMLVVVLIIGILAAVALPQYQKSVEMSRAAEALMNGQTIIESQNRALDAFGRINGDKGDLDVTLNGGNWSNNNSVYTTKDFIYTFSSTGVVATRTTRSYWLTFHNKNSTQEGQIVCSGSGSAGICDSIVQQ